MIMAVRINIAASSALTHTHALWSKSSFRSYKYFMGLCRQKTQRLDFILCFVQNICESRFPAGSRCVCCHGQRWPSHSDAGGLEVALQ